jgi:hypothetical protein
MAPLQWLWANSDLDVSTLWDDSPVDIGVCFKRPAGRPRMRILDLSDNHTGVGGQVGSAAFLAAQEAYLCVVPTPAFVAALWPHAKAVELIPDCIDPLSAGINRQPANDEFVLWYGSWGSKHHQNGGMRDILLAKDWLAGKRLMICSNNVAMAHEIGAQLPASCTWSYVEWSPQRMRTMLAAAALSCQ